MGLRDDIFEQPQVLRRLLETRAEEVRRVGRAIRQRQVEYVFLAARGTSDHAGVYAQYLWGALNRLPVALAAPSLFTLYAGSPRLQKALVVGISQSGQSPDVVSVIAEGRRQGAVTLAITNDADSPLGRAAEFTLDINAGPESAVAASKTFTAELLTVAMLSAGLREDAPAQWADLARVPEAVAAALPLDAEAQRIAAAQRGLGQCAVLGRGYSYAAALEWALKLKELTYIFADAYSASDFQHGPIAIVQPGFPVLALAPSGAALDDMLALLRRLRDEFAADLLIISDDEQAARLGQAALRLPAGTPEWLAPLVGIVPAQLYCYHLARAKGFDTEAPRHLRKVTLTR